EQRAMPPQILDCGFYTFVDLDLLNAGIAFDVKDTIGHEQVIVEFLRPADIQNRVGFAIELPDFFQGQTDSGVAWQIARAKRPAIRKVKIARQEAKKFRRVIELVSHFERVGVVRKTRRIFDVINVVSEPLQTNDVMDVLPDYACDRHRTHEAHHDDALAFHSKEDGQCPTSN